MSKKKEVEEVQKLYLCKKKKKNHNSPFKRRKFSELCLGNAGFLSEEAQRAFEMPQSPLRPCRLG